MKHTRIDFDGLSVNTSHPDKLTRVQRFWLWLAAIITVGFVAAVLAVGLLALAFFAVLAIVVAVTVVTLDDHEKEHQLRMSGKRYF